MSWIAHMSGDPELIIKDLKARRESLLDALSEIKELASQPHSLTRHQLTEDIVAICDKFLDKRSVREKMQDEIDELRLQILNLQNIIRGLMEGDE